MVKEKKTYLEDVARRVRLGILDGVFHAKSGHPGGSLSIADILTYLYFEEMRIDPERPKWEDRDRFVLSKGHAAPALYATLAARGYFPWEELSTLRQITSRLQGHPDMKGTPGVDMSTGSLGLGISAACGMALTAKYLKKDFRVYTAIGDGESEEGQVWEAAMFAAHYGLDNLVAVVDWNGLQIDGAVTDVMNPTPHDEKFRAFGWNVVTCDAHDFDEIEAAFAAPAKASRPRLLPAPSRGRACRIWNTSAAGTVRHRKKSSICRLSPNSAGRVNDERENGYPRSIRRDTGETRRNA